MSAPGPSSPFDAPPNRCSDRRALLEDECRASIADRRVERVFVCCHRPVPADSQRATTVLRETQAGRKFTRLPIRCATVDAVLDREAAAAELECADDARCAR